MRTQRILVVEDDDAVRTGVVNALEFHGYEPLEADDGDRGLERALSSEWDLMLLDLMLPGRDGLSILREVRRVHSGLPVIILTARAQESDRVKGLRLGADDYVIKPFSIEELLARIEAVLRRSPERSDPVARFNVPAGEVHLDRCEVVFDDGSRTKLSQREVEVLSYLACNSARAVSRQELLTRIWRVDPARVETRTIDMHVVRLREKLRDSKTSPSILVTVHGKGYMLSIANGGP